MTEQKIFVASEESKAKAKQLRLFAILSWIIAMVGQAFAIFKLIHNETLVWLIVVIVVILVLAITGSVLWKKANRLDPASEKDKPKFFIQNQLGAIMGVLAFLPLVILIFMNKEIDGKTKGIAGAIAVVAMLIAGITGIDFNPPSVEKYTNEINQQTDVLKKLTPGNDVVYWTKDGNKYHIYQDCYHIKGKNDITQGTIKESFDKKGISELCLTCQSKAMKEQNISSEDLINPIKKVIGSDSAK
jgi:cytochrome b subunit of formate dehydrogenase